MQVVPSYQEAMPIAGFLSSARAFYLRRRSESAAVQEIKPPTVNPYAWHAPRSGLHGLRYDFMARAWPCKLELLGHDAQLLHSLASQMVGEVLRIEEKFAPYGPHSVMQGLNTGAGRAAMRVDTETQQVLELAHHQWQSSQRMVDATSGVLRYAWGDAHLNAPRDPAELAHLITCLGWQHVQRQGAWVRYQHPALEINLGGLHEAFAIDRAVAVLDKHDGIRVTLSAGHARRVWGSVASGSVGQQEQLKTDTLAHLFQTWPQQVGGLVSYGFAGDGSAAHSLAQRAFNPKTGQPLKNWQKMVVQADTAVQADTWMKTALVKGQEAVDWLEQQQVCYWAQSRDGQFYCSAP